MSGVAALPSAARRWGRLVVPTLAALPVLATLLWLGTWQVHRLVWKTALLAELHAAQVGPAAPLTDPPHEWARVRATGTFRPGAEALLGLEVRGPVLGTRLLAVLERAGAPALLVDRGWVPFERGAPLARPAGPVTVEGYVRPGDRRNALSATDDVAGRRFYTFDPVAIGAALGVPDVEPYALVALAPADAPVTLPDPQRGFPEPTNSHLGYAITWYGLAVALVGVFCVWARRRLREPEERGAA